MGYLVREVLYHALLAIYYLYIGMSDYHGWVAGIEKNENMHFYIGWQNVDFTDRGGYIPWAGVFAVQLRLTTTDYVGGGLGSLGLSLVISITNMHT